MQILLHNEQEMISSTKRGDVTPHAAADQQIVKEAEEVEGLFDKHSKFSRKITQRTVQKEPTDTSNLLQKSKDIIQFHLDTHTPESRGVQNHKKATAKSKKRRMVLTNTCSAEQRRANTVLAQKHRVAKELLDDHGKVRWEKLKYNKEELFAKPPIFAEQVIRFQDQIIDPNKDPIHILKHSSEGFQGVSAEFTSQVKRHNSDVRNKIDKNYWVQLQMLCFDKRLREETLAQKQEFQTQHQIVALKRQNFPFYFIKPEEIQQLRKIGLETPNTNQKKLCIKQLLEYEDLMRQFKMANPGMFKRRETFSGARINLELQKQKEDLQNEANLQSTPRQSAKKQKKPTMFSYDAEQQQRNTQKLKRYIQYLQDNKDLDKVSFNWNAQSFLPQEDPSPERVELVRFKNLFKSKPRPPCERHRRSLGYMNRPNWATTSQRLKSNKSCAYFKNRPALIDIGPPNLGQESHINGEGLDTNISVLDQRPQTQMVASKTSRLCSRNQPAKTDAKPDFTSWANGDLVLSDANFSPSTQLSSTPISRSSFYQKIYNSSSKGLLKKHKQLNQRLF